MLYRTAKTYEDIRRQTFRYNPVLELIMTDIKKLESEGICVNQQLIFGVIAQCIGDNLGIHQIFALQHMYSTLF